MKNCEMCQNCDTKALPRQHPQTWNWSWRANVDPRERYAIGQWVVQKWGIHHDKHMIYWDLSSKNAGYIGFKQQKWWLYRI